MKESSIVRVALLLALTACITGLAPLFSSSARADTAAAHIRWDIVTIVPGPFAQPGGIASALSNDGSQITITGSGTFVAPAGGDGTSSAATGGGTWAVFASAGDTTPGANGTYTITGLVRWQEKGTFPQAVNAVGGLAVLRVEFSDGDHGVLTVSCHAASGSDPAIFEGITMSKSFVDYWNREAPVGGVDANRTLFHRLH
jgi:hypothetical protein